MGVIHEVLVRLDVRRDDKTPFAGEHVVVCPYPHRRCNICENLATVRAQEGFVVPNAYLWDPYVHWITYCALGTNPLVPLQATHLLEHIFGCVLLEGCHPTLLFNCF